MRFRNFALGIILIALVTTTAFANPCKRSLNTTLKHKIATFCVAGAALIPGCQHGDYRLERYEEAIRNQSLDRETRLWALDELAVRYLEKINEDVDYAESLIAAGETERPGLMERLNSAKQNIAKLKSHLVVQALPGDTNQANEPFIRKTWPWYHQVYGIPNPLGGHWDDDHFVHRAAASAWLVGLPYTLPEFLVLSFHDLVFGWNNVDPFNGDFLEQAVAAELRVQNLERRLNLLRSTPQVFGANHQIELIYHLAVNEDTIDGYRAQAANGMLPGRRISEDRNQVGTSSFFGDNTDGTFNRLWARFRDRVRTQRTENGHQGFLAAQPITISEMNETADGTIYVVVTVVANFYIPAEHQATFLANLASHEEDGQRIYKTGANDSVDFICVKVTSSPEADGNVDQELDRSLESSSSDK